MPNLIGEAQSMSRLLQGKTVKNQKRGRESFLQTIRRWQEPFLGAAA